MAETVSGAMRLHADTNAQTRMVCFAPAGAGVAAFRRWKAVIPEQYELWGICYPGREARYGQEMPADWSLLVADCLALVERTPGPRVLYGHSMGALVAYEVARILEARSQPPSTLVVSGHGAPHLHHGIGYENLGDSDEDLAGWLREKGGVDPRILDNPDLRSMAVGLLRADLGVYRQYQYEPGVMLSSEIHVLHGEGDSVPFSNLRGWEELTHGRCAQRALPGGHFFTPDVWSRLPQFMRLPGNSLNESDAPAVH